ncbi:hypothetical protein niasHS_014254 [Heterodera schachtii]|uniref:Uncharacterized protein n=1 Tax=Heterodera schachtii TaxID=97005 RepID=A0ABD2I2S9_HETSC
MNNNPFPSTKNENYPNCINGCGTFCHLHFSNTRTTGTKTAAQGQRKQKSSWDELIITESSSSGAEQNADNEGKSGDWTCWAPWKWMPPPGAFSYTQGGVGGDKPK